MELETILKPLLADIDNPAFGLQSAFDRNYSLLRDLKLQGYSLTKISDFLFNERGLSKTHFNNLLYRSKKKSLLSDQRKNHNPLPIKEEAKKTSKIESSEPVEIEETALRHSEMEWKKVNVSSLNLMRDLEKYNLTPQQVRSWGLNTPTQIRNRLGNIKKTLVRND